MMKKLLLLPFFIFAILFMKAQTFSGTGGAIPDNGATSTCFPVTVSGVGVINNTYGLASVCINITHPYVSDLIIELKGPDGTLIKLTFQDGGSDSNYTGTCFTATAATSITNGIAPFTGNYLPVNNLGFENNGQNANGVWSLCIQDVAPGDSGNLLNWNITFNNTPAIQLTIPPCNGNNPAGNTCDAATHICNFNGYCGNTNSYFYTANYWPALGSDQGGGIFCGTIENNSFVTFTA